MRQTPPLETVSSGGYLLCDENSSQIEGGSHLDNAFVERLWWSVKYEHVYRHDRHTVRWLFRWLYRGLESYLTIIYREHLHQRLEYATQRDV